MGNGDGRVRHRVKPVHDWVEVEEVPFTEAPEWPSYRSASAASRRWWDAVSSMPHCVLWRAAEWQYAMDTAELHNMLYGFNETKLASEVRQRERVLGTTLEARMKLRIRYVDPERSDASSGSGAAGSGGVASVTELDPRRARVFGAT